MQDYKNVQRWADQIYARPAVKRGRMVNRMSGLRQHDLVQVQRVLLSPPDSGRPCLSSHPLSQTKTALSSENRKCHDAGEVLLAFRATHATSAWVQ